MHVMSRSVLLAKKSDRACYESHDDEVMDAVFLEPQIQICAGETTGPNAPGR